VLVAGGLALAQPAFDGHVGEDQLAVAKVVLRDHAAAVVEVGGLDLANAARVAPGADLARVLDVGASCEEVGALQPRERAVDLTRDLARGSGGIGHSEDGHGEQHRGDPGQAGRDHVAHGSP
jgi:hypothetical protein